MSLRARPLVPALAALLLLTGSPAAAADAVPAPLDPATACPTGSVTSYGFTDVAPGTAFAREIDCIAGFGISLGQRSGAYDRASVLSRAQMALFLDRVTAYAVQATGRGERRTGGPAFDDLGGQPAAVVDAVSRLAAEGVVRGSDPDGDGTASYRPGAPLTRGEMAALLRRHVSSLGLVLDGAARPPLSSDADHFDDDAGVFEDDVDAVAEAGLAAGTGPAQFSPGRAVTREQMAVFLSRLLELHAQDGVPSRYSEGGRPLPTAPAGGVATPGAPTTVARGLTLPWGLAPLPDGSALVSERDTRLLRRVFPDGRVTTVGAVPGVAPAGEGGLLGLALSPTFGQGIDRLVYAYYSTASDNRVVRFSLSDTGQLGPQQVLLSGIPRGNTHNGGRIAFGPDGLLYIGTGDAGNTSLSQRLDSLGGKVLRINADGSVPAGNPFGGSPVFSFGHRNVQGLGFDSAGRVYSTEFGQQTFDEVNRVEAGQNYGWPMVEGRGGDSRYRDPLVTWATSEASPSGAVVVGGSFWVAALRGQRLWQVPLDGSGGVQAPRPHFVNQFGRLRAVEQVPDGSLWVLTNEADARVLRVTVS